jgi:hypothetical protein
MSVDAPLALQEEWVVCSITAAAKYQVPANIVLAIAEKEGGSPGQWKPNRNGTHDVGPMQFNTAYLTDLARYGITVNDVATAGCYSFDLAAWRLRQHLYNDKGDLWTRAANYHTRTPQYNHLYRTDLIQKASKWGDWLDARFVTVGMFKASPTQSREHNGQVTWRGVAPREGKPAVSKVKGSRLQDAKTGYVPRRLITDSRRQKSVSLD